jgi:2'-5' RNA ligase
MARLFVAIELPAAVLDRAEAEVRRLSEAGADVRWTPREQIHVTLLFLGEVPEERVAGIDDLVVTTASRAAPILLEARGLGAFPGGRAPRVVWMGVQGVSDEHRDALFRLRGALQRGARELGCDADRDDFHPHATLGRVRGPRRARALVESIRVARDREYGGFEAPEVVLIRSRLSPAGSVYSEVRRASLGE